MRELALALRGLRLVCSLFSLKRGKEALKLDPPPGRRNVHESTIVSVFKTLRTLIRWMEVQGYRRFADLDRDGCDRFLAAMAQRPGSKRGKMLKATTLQTYVNLLTRLCEVPGSGNRRSIPGDRAAVRSA